MGFAFIPPALLNSWCVCWVSFTEILTLRSHSSVVITISEPTTAYSPPPPHVSLHFCLYLVLSFLPLSVLKSFYNISSWSLSLLHGIVYILHHQCYCIVHSLIQIELAPFLISFPFLFCWSRCKYARENKIEISQSWTSFLKPHANLTQACG